MADEKQRAIPELSIDTQVVERLLAKAETGDVISYKDLSQAIGRDVQNGARHILESARRRLLREHQFVFEPVIGVGMKRLDDLGITGIGRSAVRRINRTAKRTIQKMTAIQDFDALPDQAKRDHNLSIAMLGVLHHQTRGRTMKRLEARAGQASEPLPTAKLLEAMRETL